MNEIKKWVNLTPEKLTGDVEQLKNYEGKFFFVEREKFSSVINYFSTELKVGFRTVDYIQCTWAVKKDCIIVSTTDEGVLSSDWFNSLGLIYELQEDYISTREIKKYLTSRLDNQISTVTEEKNASLRKHKELLEEELKLKFFSKTLNSEEELRCSKITKEGFAVFKFEDVYATDTEDNGEEISLGDLEFIVDIFNINKKVTLRECDGSVPQYTTYNAQALHPHHLSDCICLGSLEGDVHEARRLFDFGMLEVLLSQFAHSYSSSDSAGEYWRAWTEEGMVDRNYVPSRDESYPEDETRWSDMRDEYLHEDDAVYINGVDDYAHEEDTVYSDYLGESILFEGAVELENNRGWLPIDYEEVFEIDGRFYLEEDRVYSEHEDRDIPLDEAVQLESGDWVSKDSEDIVEIGGEYYLLEDVEKDEEGNYVIK